MSGEKLSRSVALCGFMGCGKSTVGQRLAALTGYRFVDMDRYIEQQAGRSVRAVFETYGEPHFRALEAAACADLSTQTGRIIAAGGGAVLFPENARILRQNCIVVWLDASLETVLARLEGDTTRPLLQGPDAQTRVRALWQERRPLYAAAAHLTVVADGTPEAVAHRIAAELKICR